MAFSGTQATMFFAEQETSSACEVTSSEVMGSFSVLLFASLKDAVATSVIEVRVAEAKPTVADLLACCAVQYPALQPYLPYVRVAVNCEYSNEQQSLQHSDEIALLPPVSGGASESADGGDVNVDKTLLPLVSISDAPIDTSQVARSAESCLQGGAGAVVTFEGIVRNNAAGHWVQYLEYAAYEPMAARELRRISEEVQTRWQLPCALVHRIGRLEIGEASIVIAVAAPHRAEAFEACRYAIDRVKETVPVWKKEVARDGTWWVEDPLHTI